MEGLSHNLHSVKKWNDNQNCNNVVMFLLHTKLELKGKASKTQYVCGI